MKANGLGFAVIVLWASTAWAGPSMSSGSNTIARDAGNAGGQVSSSPSNQLTGSIGEEVVFTTAASSANRLRGGWSELHAFPGGAPDFAAQSDVSKSSVTFQWTSQGLDGSVGVLPAGSQYFIRVASYTAPDTFTWFGSADITIATSGVAIGTLVGAPKTGLLANTTYWARLWALDTDANLSFGSGVSTFVTLAPMPAAAAPPFTVYETSMTVSWLPNGNAADVSTYTVVLTTDSFYPNSDAGNVVFGTVPAGALPTATLTGLPQGTTYSLFVDARNWADASSGWLALGSMVTSVTPPQPKSFVGGCGNTNWYNAACWSPSGVPGPNDAVTIASPISVVVNASSPSITFSSLTIGSPAGVAANLTIATTIASGGSVLIYGGAGLTQATTMTLTITGDLTMVSGSSLTHRAITANPANAAVNVTVTGNFDLQPGATVTAAGAGFAGGGTGTTGSGPNPGTGTGTNNRGGGGGGHGGAGGAGTGGAAGGAANDTATDPTNAGSGGGGGRSGAGGAGGGLIRLSAAGMAIDGWIVANGAGGVTAASGGGGGGAGGGVQLTADQFSGSGVVQSTGGYGGSATSGFGGGGGGGIVSISVTGSGSLCSMSFAVSGGTSGATGGSPGVLSTTATLSAATGLIGVPSATSIDWSWSAVGGNPQYQLFSATGAAGASPMSPVLSSNFYTTTGLSPNTTVPLYVRATACSTLADSATTYAVTLANPPTAPAQTFTAAGATSLSTQWLANGDPVGVTTYTVVVTTTSSYPNTSAANVSFTTAPASLSATFTGLYPNTTYYFFASAMNHAGTRTSWTALGSTATLASPPSPGVLEFLSIQASSVTVAWAALFPNDVSSMTCEGYTLLASSDNFGTTGAPVFSSAAYSAYASTLSVGVAGTPLDLSSTYYFKVGSLNWSGQPNYTTLGRLNFQIQQSTGLLHLGSIDPGVTRSTVSTSSMVVTNVGNWPVTIQLTASTATAPTSPWALGTAAGVETAVLMGSWNSGAVGPAPSAFTTYLTTTTYVSGSAGGKYAGTQTGLQIPAGQSRTLWFYFTIPSQSSTLGPETIQVAPSGVYP